MKLIHIINGLGDAKAVRKRIKREEKDAERRLLEDQSE